MTFNSSQSSLFSEGLHKSTQSREGFGKRRTTNVHLRHCTQKKHTHNWV